MMSPEWLVASVRYNRWMNDKLYGLAATLSDEYRKPWLGGSTTRPVRRQMAR